MGGCRQDRQPGLGGVTAPGVRHRGDPPRVKTLAVRGEARGQLAAGRGSGTQRAEQPHAGRLVQVDQQALADEQRRAGRRRARWLARTAATSSSRKSAAASVGPPEPTFIARSRRALSAWVAGWSSSKNRTPGERNRSARSSYAGPEITIWRIPAESAASTGSSKNRVRAIRLGRSLPVPAGRIPRQSRALCVRIAARACAAGKPGPGQGHGLARPRSARRTGAEQPSQEIHTL